MVFCLTGIQTVPLPTAGINFFFASVMVYSVCLSDWPRRVCSTSPGAAVLLSIATVILLVLVLIANHVGQNWVLTQFWLLAGGSSARAVVFNASGRWVEQEHRDSTGVECPDARA